MTSPQNNQDTSIVVLDSKMMQCRLADDIIRSQQSGLPFAVLLLVIKQGNHKFLNEGADSVASSGANTAVNLAINPAQEASQLLLDGINRRLITDSAGSYFVASLGTKIVIVLPDLQDININSTVHSIIKKLHEPFNIEQQLQYISVNIGISFYPDDANDADTLFKNAEQMVTSAINKGSNSYHYFSQSGQDLAQSKERMNKDLHRALEEEQFEIYYQPIVNMRSGTISKAEALLRWHHPLKGLLNPMEFLPVAEETGLIHDIGDWVFNDAVLQANTWKNNYNSELQIAINMSPLQFKLEHQLFETEWFNALLRVASKGLNIIIEVTESLLQEVTQNVIDKIRWLRKTGFEIAIDDFGAGYSSVASINKIKFDYIKIDRQLVSALDNKPEEIAVCEAIIAMAHKLKLKVIAEGVETESQEKILIDAGCDFAQGYFFSTPVPVAEFEQLLKHGCQQTDIL
ncbi:diguanylate cyclase/phosphodiesterase (GGDEF & EAL domains) with PAS/PAC sensor(s) [hydrothermal vent metagenome]|uniref:Diguanylate cyclase/phosphodiesterase (GGDEF & EAL domains) with PAS/PAC sensor(S) n=1 Tax=hydrothermal vent metagenome TaxID=652676 RepID=A0A3B0Z141_9ZZZZ